MRLIPLVLLCFFTLTATAQPSHFLFNKITTANGLASNEVLSVWQDKKGFIWVGTVNGLQRYDGKKFVSFPSLDEEGFGSKPISQIMGDSSGHMWLKAGRDYGIFDPANFTFQKTKFNTKQKLEGDELLYQDGDGNIFIIYYRVTILRYDRNTNSFVDELPFRIPAGWKINTLFHDARNKEYWIGCDSGIAIYNTQQKQLYTKSNNPQKNPLLSPSFHSITSIHIDKQRRAWINYWPEKTGAQFASYDLTKKQFLPDTAGLYNAYSSYYQVNKIFETSKGGIWMSGSDVLLNYNAEEHRFYNNKGDLLTIYGITFGLVNQMVEDRETNVWVATDGGLYSFSPEMADVDNYFFYAKDGDNNLNGFAELENGELWFSRWGKGILRRGTGFEKLNSDKLITHPSKEIDGILKLSWDVQQSSVNKKVFVGLQSGWVQVADQNTLQSTVLRPAALGHRTVRQISEDRKGILWFGTQGGQIVKYDPRLPLDTNNFKLVQQLSDIILKLYVDRNEQLWACTDGSGVYCINSNNGQIIKHYNSNGEKNRSLNDKTANDIAQVNDSIYAIAANTFHILNIKTGIIRQYNYYDGLSSNKITGLLTDNFSNVWIGTPNGVCRYNYTKDNFIRFSYKDGFAPMEPIGENSLLLKDGSVLMSGRNQVTRFRPLEFNTAISPPAVTITDIKLFNDYLPLDSLNNAKKIRFNHNQNSLTFYFSALSFLQGDKLKYFYRLEGANKEWQLADNSMSVNYTLLPPGKYNFQVRCENEQGISSAITEMSFTIVSPFYTTWWFLLLVLIAVMAEVYFIFRLRKNRRMALEKMRTQVARDLHDDMGSTLSTINILSAMAKKKLQTDAEKSNEYLGKITDNSQRMMEVMDDIVWSIKPSNDSMQKISGRMREFATSVLEAKDIELDFRVDEKVHHIKLDMTARRDFFLIFKEAVNNIAKYSHCKKASVHVALHNKRLILIIKDDGVGFNVEKADAGNGLGNMQKRADALKARLHIQSKEGLGTRVTLNMQG